MIKIFENTPYRSDKDLIEAYNSFMELLPEDGWAVFRDADTLFLDSFYGELIEKAIMDNPDTDCFTCLTNRIGCPAQLYYEYSGDDIVKHRNIAKNLREKNYGKYRDFKISGGNIMSGMLMILSKKSWREIGGFKEYTPNYSRILGVDNKLHQDLENSGFKVKIIDSLYIYHWYRGGTNNKSHLT